MRSLDEAIEFALSRASGLRIDAHDVKRVKELLAADGFAIVPKEPSYEMVLAVAGPIKGAVETYKAMLQALEVTS